MRTVRISFDNNKLKETYPMALRGYITPVDFFSRVQVLNTILHRHQKFRRLFRDLFIGSIIVAALTAFVLLAMVLKRINANDPHTSTDANNNSFASRITQPLRVCLCIILGFLILATAFLVGLTKNKGEKELRAIEWNVAEWNALDMANGIKWNLIVKENHDKVIADKFIQVDIISTSLSISETSININNANHSQHSSTSLSTTPPPSYEVALTDPPPPLPPCDS